MNNRLERELLEQYAKASNQNVLASQSDLDPKDPILFQMLNWCLQQGNIVVLKSGTILTSAPTSRVVQNCKAVLKNHGIIPKTVRAATSQLIQMLLANAIKQEQKLKSAEQVSTQQQRLRSLIQEALRANASDIHIEVRPNVARIRFRTHGELYAHAEWMPQLARELAAVAFNKETDYAVSHFNPLIPQNASMPLDVQGEHIRLRLASIPAHGGFDLVLRMLTTGSHRLDTLRSLGYANDQVLLLEKAIQLPHGAIIISGPTGSGKTTTLASCMQLVDPRRKNFTIEDPVEKVVDLATQIPINTEHNEQGFAQMGKAALRMDPDVITLGEMRDRDTAAVMARAAITGHLVFSTLHTNSAPGIITRLLDLGISSTLLSDPSFLQCLVCQTLIPTLIKEASIPVQDSPLHQPHLARWKQLFKKDFTHLRARNRKTPAGHGLGISGRTVVAEVIWIDEPSRHFIKNADILGWQQYLKDNGWKNMGQRVIEWVRQGLCDPLDAELLLGEMTILRHDRNFNYRTLRTADSVTE